MARIRDFINGDRDVKPPQSGSDVDWYVQKVTDADGTIYLHLYNYRAGGPASGDSPTESMHFDRRSARSFIEILKETFGNGELRTQPVSMPTPTTLAALRAFVAERDWDQFPHPRELGEEHRD